MKSIEVMLLSVVLVSLAGCNKMLVPTGREEAITIDGKADDWNRDFYLKAPNHNLIYAYNISNEHLNILLKGMDDKIAKKMMFMGITIWLDGKGKKSKRQAIVYPNGVVDYLITTHLLKRGNLRPALREETKLDDEALRIFERNKSTIGLIGFFDNSKEPFIYKIDQLNIGSRAVMSRVSTNEVVIELSVPLALIKKKNKQGIIGIGIETNTINLRDMIVMQTPIGMGRGGRMMPRPKVMRMSQGRGKVAGQSSGQLRELNDQVSVWSKLQINE